VQTRQVVPVVASRYILMTGAAANQEALDGPVEGRYHGFFSYSLAKSIGAADQAATPRDIFSGVEREMRRIQAHFGRTSMPEPQLEAPLVLLDRPLLPSLSNVTTVGGAPQSTRLPWVEVQRAGTDGFLLTQGVTLGAQPGSTWMVFPPNETAFVPGQSLGLLVVTKIRDHDALAQPQGTPFSIPAGARAVAFLPAAPPERIPIRLLDIPAEGRAKIEEVLRQYGRGTQIVGAGQPAHFLVDVQDHTLNLYSADGLQLVSSLAMDEPGWGAGLTRVLSRSANISDLLTLDNPSSQLKVAVKVAGSQHRASRGIAVVADTQPAQYHIRRNGEPRAASNSLQLEIQATGDSYITVVDVDSEGHLNLLFPNDHQRPTFYPDGRVRAGETVTIPDSPQSGNHAGFYWDYAAPAGTDTVRVFASTDLETAQAIRRRVQRTPTPSVSSTAVVMTRAVVSEQVINLRHDLGKVATRGLSSVYDLTPAALTTQPPSAQAAQPAAPPAPAPTVSVPPQQSMGASTPAVTTQPAGQTAAVPAADWTAASLTIQVEP
jgi:hypothetical protein